MSKTRRESQRSGRSQQNYYWTINNQGINVITIVSRRKKIVAITQVNHDDPYLLINLLLLPRQTFFLSQSMSLVNTYTLFLTAFFCSFSDFYHWCRVFSRFSVKMYVDKLSLLWLSVWDKAVSMSILHHKWEAHSFPLEINTLPVGGLLFSSLSSLNYAYLVY